MTPPRYIAPLLQPIGQDGLRTFLRWVMDDPQSRHAKAATLVLACYELGDLSAETKRRLCDMPEPHLLEAIDALAKRQVEYRIDSSNIGDYLRLWVGPLDWTPSPSVAQRGVRLLQLDDDEDPEQPPIGGLVGFAWVRDHHPSARLREEASIIMTAGFMGQLDDDQVRWLVNQPAAGISASVMALREARRAGQRRRQGRIQRAEEFVAAHA